MSKEIGVVELRSHVGSLNEPGLLEELDEALVWKRQHRSWVYYYCPEPCPERFCEGKFSSKELYQIHMEEKKRVAGKRAKDVAIVHNGWTEDEKIAADAGCIHGGRVETICRLVKQLGERELLTQGLVNSIKDLVEVGIENNEELIGLVADSPSTSFLHAMDDATMAKIESLLNDVVDSFRSLDFLGEFKVVLDRLENKMRETPSPVLAEVNIKVEEGRIVVSGGVDSNPGAWQSVKDHHCETAKDLFLLFNHMSRLLESNSHTKRDLEQEMIGLIRIRNKISAEDILRKNNAEHIPVRYTTLLLELAEHGGLELDDAFTDILEAKDPGAEEFPQVGEQEDATVRSILQTCSETHSRKASLVASTILLIQNSVDKVLGHFLEHTSGVDYRFLLISLWPEVPVMKKAGNSVDDGSKDKLAAKNFR